MKNHRIIPAALLLCTLAACGQTPTGADPGTQPGGASFDGGYTMGSGNRSTASGGYTIGSGTLEGEEGAGGIGSEAEDGSATDDAPAPGGTESERGGYTMGSGN